MSDIDVAALRAAAEAATYHGGLEQELADAVLALLDVIRATLRELGFEPDTDPVLAARKRMAQREVAESKINRALAAESKTLAGSESER